MFNSTVASAEVYGGVGGDSFSFKGAISSSTIDFGADNDSLTLNVAATSSTIIGGAGADTLVFSSGANLVTSSVSGGADGDSLVFSVVVKSATSIAGGGGNDTMVFNSSLSGVVVSLDAGADSVTFVTQVAGSSTLFGGGVASSQTVNFSAAADLATFDGTFGGGSILGGSGADTLVFAAGVEVASGFTLKTEAGADSLTFTNNVISGQFGLGAGADFVGGNITVGSNAVSFFSGSGNDTFNMTSVTVANAGGGTAYFWNEAGTDSIVLGGQFDSGLSVISGRTHAEFGITSGASMNISFATAGALGEVSRGLGDFSGNFTVHNNVVSYGFAATQVTIVFAGGGGVTLNGAAFEAATGTNIFSNFSASTGTANFGLAGYIPSFS
jgi:hypothetical protein